MKRDPIADLVARQHPVIATPARRPVALLVLIVATLTVGMIALSRIELALIPPGLEARSLSVDIDLRNTGTSWSPKEVEQRITLEVEGELATIPGIQSLKATSSRDEAEFDIAFSGDADMTEAYAQVRDRVERARMRIGDLVDQPRIRRFSMSDMPIASMSIIWEDWVENPWDKLNNRVKPAIESAEGITALDASGETTPYFRVALDRRKLAALSDIGIRELIDRLQGDNFSQPAGKISSGAKDTFIILDARFESLEQLRNLPVSETLRLSDIADVTLAYGASAFVMNYAWQDEPQMFDGGRGVYCRISKASDASIVKAGAGLMAAVRELEADPQLAGFKFRVVSNQGDDIIAQLSILQESLLIGGLLAVLVLMLFLKRFRLALIIALAIPLSMTMALVTMYFAGEYLSMLALMGFTVAGGMLLDNAIVVSENIYRRLSIDKHSFTAAVRGASEVGLALALATSTTVVVFLSVAFFNESEVGRFMMARLGFPIVFSLGFSILVALAIIPATMSRVFSTGSESKGMRGWWHRTHKRIAHASIPVRWLAGPLGTVFGRSPEVPASTRMGDWIDGHRQSRAIWLGIWMMGLSAGAVAGWLSFRTFGGTDFFGPVADKLTKALAGIAKWFAESAGGAASDASAGARGGMGGRGGGGESASVFPTVASVAIGAAVAMIPAMIAWLSPRREQAYETSPVLARASKVYGHVIAWILRRPVLVLCYLMVGLGSLIAVGLAMTEFTQSNTGANKFLMFRVSFPDTVRSSDVEPDLSKGFDTYPRDWQFMLKTREELFGIPVDYEQRLKADPSVLDSLKPAQQAAFEKYGIARGSLSLRQGGMMSFISLDERRSADAKELEDKLRTSFPNFAGFRVTGGFDGSQGNRLRITLTGPEYKRLEQIAGVVVPRLEAMPSLSNISDSATESFASAEAVMLLDFARAMSMGVNPEQFARIVQFQVNGSRLNDYMRGDETRPIRLVYDYPQDRAGRERTTTLEDLLQLRIPRTDGHTRLDAVIKPPVEVMGGSDEIVRQDGQTAYTITANMRGSSNEIRSQVDEIVASVLEEMRVGPAYTAETTAGFESARRSGRRGRGGPENPLDATSLLAAILLISIVMAFLFESLSRPLVVLFACIPGAIVGAIWALLATNTMFDALCGLGVVVLLGVAVNNGIVFVDLINRLRKEGLTLESAIRSAGEQRLRPMLMTSFTTIAGLIPMSVSTSAFFDMPYFPLARTILGGMIVSTAVALIAVPVWYGVIETSREYASAVFASVFRRGNKR